MPGMYERRRGASGSRKRRQEGAWLGVCAYGKFGLVQITMTQSAGPPEGGRYSIGQAVRRS